MKIELQLRKAEIPDKLKEIAEKIRAAKGDVEILILLPEYRSFIGSERVIKIAIHKLPADYYLHYKIFHPEGVFQGIEYKDWILGEGEYFRKTKEEIIDLVKDKILAAVKF